MRRITAMYSTSIMLALLVALFVFHTGPAAAASPLACGTWKAIPSVNEGDGAELLSVSALAVNDVWSVGDFDGSGYRHTLTEHWDGKSWQVVSSPDGQTILNQLTGVMALSRNDVWAVGHYRKDFSSDSTLIEHWDGTQWSIVPSANTSSQINYFNGVASVSASDIWGVGSHVDLKKNGNAVYHTLVEHWNGTKWNIVASADPGNGGNVLNGVTAVSANDVWAVGSHTTKTGSSVSLIEH